MSDYIPYELLVDILVRLPVASLLRFKSVCKSWNSLITNPSFVTKHLNHSKTNSEKILFGLCTEGNDQRPYLLCRDNEQFRDELSELKFLIPLDLPLHYFRIVGSLNGILCLRVPLISEISTIILWNPSTRKSIIVPKPEFLHNFVLGFGLQPATHDYKLVKIEYVITRLGNGTKVDIYTHATGWRGIVSTFPSNYKIEHQEAQAFVNGTINWIGIDYSKSRRERNTVVSFDTSTETFSALTLPPALGDELDYSIAKVFQGSLAVFFHQRWDDTALCIWVMKEYGVSESWTKVLSFDLSVEPSYVKALGFRKHGDILLWTRMCRLLSYDIRSKALTDTGIRGSKYAYYYVEPFVETLVSLESQNGVLEEPLNSM